ncbi:hypothetical protein IWQ56_002732, partial [Coemansia nantahalensis]
MHAYHTKVLSASATRLSFASALEDGAFTAGGPDTQWIDASTRELRAGRCVAIPTETVYGLAANALDRHAVQSIFAAKGRP